MRLMKIVSPTSVETVHCQPPSFRIRLSGTLPDRAHAPREWGKTAMASERQNMSDQEISIKAREHELYVKSPADENARPTKPFPVYLRETPAEPLSSATKAILWVVGIVVALLFLAAVWRVSQGHLNKTSTKTGLPASKTAVF